MRTKPMFDGFVLAGKTDFADIKEACEFGISNFPEAFSLPGEGDPLRIHLEGMPCIDKDKAGLSFQLPGREDELVEFYDRYFARDLDYFAISPELDSALYEFAEIYRKTQPVKLKLLHFSLRGPYTLASMAKDEQENIVAWHNDTIRDLIVKQTAMKIMWREKKIRELLPDLQTMVVIGEPSLPLYTSSVGSGSWSIIAGALDEVLQAVEGISCVHCCSNFDWSMLMATKVDCINFDAYEHGDSMSLYADDLERFLVRGGSIAWGIVPTAGVNNETPRILVERLEGYIESLADRGVNKQLLIESSWVTPQCAPGALSKEIVRVVCSYTREVSQRMKKKYFG